jgi:outer membrane protein assembly factor BamB
MHTSRRAAVALAALLSLVWIGVAGAAPVTAITLGQAETPPGTRVKVTGTGFGASENVTITLNATVVLATVKSGRGGGFSLAVTVPQTQPPGLYVVRATGARTGRTAAKRLRVRTSWRAWEFAGNRTGVNPYENVLAASNVATLAQQWSKTNASPTATSPVLSEGRLFYGTESILYARSAATGDLLWKRQTGATLFAAPTVAGDAVIIPTGFRFVRAYRVDTGAPLWTFDFGIETSSRSPALVANGRVFVVNEDGFVHALKLKTGAPIWSKHLGANRGGAPAVWKDKVLVTNSLGTYALDQATGRVVWRRAAITSNEATPSVVAGVAYVAAISLWALNADTGATIWEHSSLGGMGSVAVAGDSVYAVAQAGLYAVSVSDGTERWHVLTDDVPASESAAVANGVVYIGEGFQDVAGAEGNGELLAIDAVTGSLVHTITLGQPIAFGPIVANGHLYVVTQAVPPGTDGGTAYAFGL